MKITNQLIIDTMWILWLRSVGEREALSRFDNQIRLRPREIPAESLQWRRTICNTSTQPRGGLNLAILPRSRRSGAPIRLDQIR
jgi:hypothetical protein